MNWRHGSKSLLTDEQWQEAARVFELGEKKAPELADELGVSIGSFNWNMLRLGASPPGAKVPPARRPGAAIVKRGNHEVRAFSEDEDQKIRDMGAEGKRTAEIARALGRHWNSTRGRAMTLARHDDRKEAADGKSI